MLKKIAILLAVLLVPVLIMSAGDTISRDQKTYQDLKSLSDAGIITKPLTKDNLTRAEVVEYINDGVHNVLAANVLATSTSSDTELSGQIEKLYNLVKAYMTDMMKTQQKLDSIIETIGDLKVKKDSIEKRQDKLLSSMGMRINGESSAYMTDVLLFGSKYIANAEPAKRYRPITQYLDLKFSLNATKELYAEATFRVENLYGGFWGSMDIQGLKRFFIQGQYPVSFVFGDYQGKLTPYTLWAVDDQRPYEAKIFSDKRDMNKKELYLLDNTWPLSGAKAQTILELFDTVDVDITVLGARLGEGMNSGEPARSYYQLYSPSQGVFMPNPYNHDEYLIGGSIHSGVSDLFKLGVNYSEIIDSKDTGTFSYATLDNYVTSADGEFKIKFGDDGQAKVKAEFAKSSYTNNKWFQNYITDTALKGAAEATFMNSTLGVSYSLVGNSYTAYAAQTRMSDERNSYMYLTQNNAWNITTAPPSYLLGGKTYPFTRYNPAINVSYGNSAGSGSTGLAYKQENLFYFPVYENNTMPYGDSTPNRKNITVKYSGNYLDGIIQPSIQYVMANEIVSSLDVTYTVKPRNFTVIEGGVKSEFTLGIPWTISAGYKTENTDNGQTNSIALISSTIDAGIEGTIIKKKLKAYAGYKNIAFAGSEYGVAWNAMSFSYKYGLRKYDATITSMGAGVEYYIAKPAVIGVSFTNTVLADKNNKTLTDFLNNTKPLSYSVQELDIKVSISF
ncbi:MAG: hypothetical protein WCJ94_00015 [bacterium]